MNRLLQALPEGLRARLRPRPDPAWIAPMLATPGAAPPAEGAWLYEPKLDGVRCLAFVSSRGVRLLSRNRKPLERAYPEIVSALERLDFTSRVLDGEIVAFEDGVTSFSRLQQRMQLRDPVLALRSGVAAFFYLFDLPYYDGYDLTALPLTQRKALLRKAVRFADPIRYTAHRRHGAKAFFCEACERGWEGILAKRTDSVYVSARSSSWLKLKCVSEQELVIAGYTAPKGARERFGALLMGYYEGGELRYAGKVGTGFDQPALEYVHSRLVRLHRQRSPFAGPVQEDGVQWVSPQLVAQIGFAEWTPGGLLRHPRFLGLRDDIEADEVRRERAG